VDIHSAKPEEFLTGVAMLPDENNKQDENQPLHPKVALVTGAGRRRIGNVVAQALAKRGYRVALHYHRSESDARQTVEGLVNRGHQAIALGADVSDESEVARLIREVVERFGRLDLLVTTAAIWEKKPLEEVAAADLLRHLAVNVMGTFLCCLYAGRVMVAQPEGGVIVTIGDWATRRPYRDYPAYFVSKGSIPTLTRMFAVELAARNPRVRVNCILPGPVMLPEDLDGGEREEAIRGTLLKREGGPENIAQAVCFLADNDYITGVCIAVDGGRSICPF